MATGRRFDPEEEKAMLFPPDAMHSRCKKRLCIAVAKPLAISLTISNSLLTLC